MNSIDLCFFGGLHLAFELFLWCFFPFCFVFGCHPKTLPKNPPFGSTYTASPDSSPPLFPPPLPRHLRVDQSRLYVRGLHGHHAAAAALEARWLRFGRWRFGRWVWVGVGKRKRLGKRVGEGGLPLVTTSVATSRREGRKERFWVAWKKPLNLTRKFC